MAPCISTQYTFGWGAGFTIGFGEEADHPRLNASTAAYAHVRYTGETAATEIRSLSYYYRGRVTFSLPDPISPSGQVLIGPVSVVVYDGENAVVFNSTTAKVVGGTAQDRCVLQYQLAVASSPCDDAAARPCRTGATAPSNQQSCPWRWISAQCHLAAGSTSPCVLLMTLGSHDSGSRTVGSHDCP